VNEGESFSELAARRTSCRSYRTDPVPEEHIRAMLEAGRVAPSACNKQPWRFAVVRDKDSRRQLVDDAFLPGFSMKWAHDAPVIFALGFERSLVTHRVASRLSGVDYALMDLGIAGEHIVLQATELGLGTCWIGWIRPKVVEKIVGWPGGIHARALITVGWPGDTDMARRPRLDLSDIATWI
jgi:nitroreductase